jgi:hypothetical protein
LITKAATLRIALCMTMIATLAMALSMITNSVSTVITTTTTTKPLTRITGTDKSASRDSGYNSDRTDVTMIEDTDYCYLAEVDRTGRPVRKNYDADELDKFGKAIRKYKALLQGHLPLDC